ncbi:MAG: hypothetical protein L6R42_006090, partial [Xanthoria sp. 1 TBL-2021]
TSATPPTPPNLLSGKSTSFHSAPPPLFPFIPFAPSSSGGFAKYHLGGFACTAKLLPSIFNAPVPQI